MHVSGAAKFLGFLTHRYGGIPYVMFHPARSLGSPRTQGSQPHATRLSLCSARERAVAPFDNRFAGGGTVGDQVAVWLNNAEQTLWSQVIAVPALGILITPEQGEVLSCLMRD